MGARGRAVLPLALCLLGLWFLGLSLASGAGPVSPFWWLELPLHMMVVGALLVILWQGRPPAAPDWRRPALALLVFSWTFGMAYELTLSVDGTGIGGVHPETRASFLLAQGDYVPIALLLWAAVRWGGIDVIGAYWLGFGLSLTEGLVFTGELLARAAEGDAAGFLLALGYYALAYAAFVALPVAFVRPAAIRGRAVRGLPDGAAVLLGLAGGMAIRLLWGLALAPLIARLFGLPPNPL